MTTQIGQSPGIAVGGVRRTTPAGPAAQTEGAVKPVISPADAGEESRPREQEIQHKALENPALGSNARLTIEQDSDTGKYVYKTVDRETGKVIRQWPREKLLKAIAAHQDGSGLIVDKKV